MTEHGRKCAGRVLLFALAAAFTILSVLAGFVFGSVRLEISDIFGVITGGEYENTSKIILLELRLPRVIAAMLAGAALATAGLLLQNATDNDLCSPNVIGVNAGAGFASMICMCFFPAYFRLLPAAAFAGALITTLCVLGISFSARRSNTKATVLLAGVAAGALLNSGISFLSQLYPDVLPSYAAFSAGGFTGIHTDELLIPSLMIAVGTAVATLLAQRLNLLCLGDELAGSLGVRVKTVRFTAIATASLLCAAAVSFAGLLGFVGLIVPHMARRMAGNDMRVLIPFCCLCGGSLVVLSDLAARTLFMPAELPAGILMAALGAPFFLWLLLRKERTP